VNVLVADGLCKGYPNAAPVLQDVSLQLASDETMAIIGPSGCGKTTLLYLLCGLLQPDLGTVALNGRPIHKTTPRIAIILQDFGLLPWKTVLGNVTLGLKLGGLSRAVRDRRAGQLLEELGLHGREQDYPGQLSGGEQQRVAIARALALEPELLLMDEPFSSLDAMTREKLQHILLDTWRERRVPYVLVTHSVEEAVFLGRRILLLAAKPASIVASFTNNGFGESAHRHSKAYFHVIRVVRQAMEKYW
jgi:ABC-type nitrate/sulfonate/bicarbonate transport system ATPase subunit